MFKEPFINSTNGSLMGYFLEPHNTLCSKMCGMPFELSTGVRKTAPNVLFSSLLMSDMTSAPARVQCTVLSAHSHNRIRTLLCVCSGILYSDTKECVNILQPVDGHLANIRTSLFVAVHENLRIILPYKLLPNQLKAMQLLRSRPCFDLRLRHSLAS